MFHCHGGKDRTGVVAAVLLLALGVDRETVLDDYEATRRYRTIEDQQDSLANILASGVSPEAAASVLGTPRWAMAAAVDAVDDVYGGDRGLPHRPGRAVGVRAGRRCGLAWSTPRRAPDQVAAEPVRRRPPAGP